MNFFSKLFEKIAERMGWQIVKKLPDSNYAEHKEINLTATIANRIATLTMLDSDVQIEGDSARAKFMQDFTADYVADRMAVAAEVSLGTGDALVKPWTDGERIGIDIIGNEDFRVCDSIGGFIKSVIIRCDVLEQGGKTYQRFEGQRLGEVDGVPTLFIDQFVYADQNEINDKNQWPIAWQDIKEEDYIPNVDNLLLGRYKCPTVNRADVNSENGVKITYGLDMVMDKAVEAFNRFNDEMKKKETMLFVDRTMVKRDDMGNYVLPQDKNKMFLPVNTRDSRDMIHEWSPDMRTEQLEYGIQVNFRMLELLSGLSNGILTPPTTAYATATEMKASLQLTYAFITKFRMQLVKGTNELLNAVDIICNRNNITPMGEWEAKYDWSSSYIENVEEQFNRLMQAQGIGAVDRAEVRAWTMDEPIDVARERVDEIRTEQMNEARELMDGQLL